nr:MAG TPA: hypothetical protein [Caudoviricetes sp.]
MPPELLNNLIKLFNNFFIIYIRAKHILTFFITLFFRIFILFNLL